jgi:hypothetical protein
MSDLRERFRALDTLDVPDVMSRARLIGPKPPEPDPTPPFRRAGALVFAAIVAALAVFLITRALDESPRPADPPTPTPSDNAFRRDGEVITYSNTTLGAGATSSPWTRTPVRRASSWLPTRWEPGR